MGSRLDRYGLERPEVKGRVRSRRDSLKVIEASHKAFIHEAGRVTGKDRDWYLDDGLSEELYGEACRIVEGLDGLEGLDRYRKGIEDLIDRIAVRLDGTGLYLSALMNRTGLDGLTIDTIAKLDRVGYRIPRGKTLAIGNLTPAYSAGEFGEGVVLNWGVVESLAPHASAGCQINWGYAEVMAYGASGGVQMNFGRAHKKMSSFSENGLQVNYGKTELFAYGPSGGVQANLGEVIHSIANDADGGLQINFGKADSIGDFSGGGIQLNAGKVVFGKTEFAYFLEAEGWLLDLVGRMKGVLGRAGFLKGMEQPDDESLERIRGFDFEGFEQDARKAAGEVEAYWRRIYGKRRN